MERAHSARGPSITNFTSVTRVLAAPLISENFQKTQTADATPRRPETRGRKLFVYIEAENARLHDLSCDPASYSVAKFRKLAGKVSLTEKIHTSSINRN